MQNPHNDKQAEDRAWRIGQTRDVQVIRLIVKDTIEVCLHVIDIYDVAESISVGRRTSML